MIDDLHHAITSLIAGANMADLPELDSTIRRVKDLAKSNYYEDGEFLSIVVAYLEKRRAFRT